MTPDAQARIRDMYVARLQSGTQPPQQAAHGGAALGPPASTNSWNTFPSAGAPAGPPVPATAPTSEPLGYPVPNAVVAPMVGLPPPAEPARRSIGAARPAEASPPHAPASDELGKIKAAIKALADEVRCLKDSHLSMYAKPKDKVHVYDKLPKDGGSTVHTYSKGGNWVQLFYPIESMENGDLWMRTKFVARDAGEVTEGWVRVKDGSRGTNTFVDYSAYERDDTVERRLAQLEAGVQQLASSRLQATTASVPRRSIKPAPAAATPPASPSDDFMTLK